MSPSGSAHDTDIIIWTICNNGNVWYILDYVDFMTITPSVLSGLPDPMFGVLTTNPNFTSIVKTALAHAPGGLASRLGYRGFTITLYRGGKRLSRDTRFPKMWYVQPAKPQISLRIRAV